MSLFLPNIPQPGDNLDFSQGQLLSNNQGLDTVFGINHTLFSDSTVNKGNHTIVSTIPQGSIPVTTTNPVFFAYQQTANMGVIQFSGGPSAAVPTPVTSLHSPSTPIILANGASTNVFNFSGLNIAIANIYAFNADAGLNNFINDIVYWNGTIFKPQISTGSIQIILSGTTMQIKNTSGGPFNNLYWTLQFLRVQ